MSDEIKYFLVPVPHGKVYVHALRDGQVHVSTEYPRYAHQQKRYEGTPCEAALTVNGVAYHVRAWLNRNEAGRWEAHDRLSLTRYAGSGDATSSATQAVLTTLYPAVAAWLESAESAPLKRAMTREQQAQDRSRELELRGKLVELDQDRAEIMAELEKLTGGQ
jgi:hypothetical protein